MNFFFKKKLVQSLMRDVAYNTEQVKRLHKTLSCWLVTLIISLSDRPKRVLIKYEINRKGEEH